MGQEKITDPREEGTLVSLDKQMILISCEGERRNPVSGLGRWIAQYHILTRTHLYEGVEKKDNYFHLASVEFEGPAGDRWECRVSIWA